MEQGNMWDDIYIYWKLCLTRNTEIVKHNILTEKDLIKPKNDVVSSEMGDSLNSTAALW